jgi:hypothetical protein
MPHHPQARPGEACNTMRLCCKRRSGEFSIMDRILQSVRNNLIYYAVLLLVGLAGLLLLLLTGRLKVSNVVGFCIAFSNAYGELAVSCYKRCL